MIVFLFDYYFNPLQVRELTQHDNDVKVWFGNVHHITIRNAKIYDVAASINSAIEDFHKGKA
jgi:hypothetical protein